MPDKSTDHDHDRLIDHHRFEREPPAAGPPQRSPTRKEAVPRPPAAPPPPARAPAPPPAEDDALPFRPFRRPPVAMLCVLDDEGEDGEWVRLRADATVIGRSQGAIVIPHDGLMSGRHAELTRVTDGTRYHWLLADLGSTNGTFVKVERAALKPGKELMIGRTRFRFEAPAPADLGPPPADPKATVGWQAPSAAALAPSLVVLTPREDGPRFPLVHPHAVIGRDPDCTIPLPDDPLAARRHARLARDPQGHWHIAAEPAARNGLWLRITDPLPVGRTCLFLLGEQRFLFKAP